MKRKWGRWWLIDDSPECWIYSKNISGLPDALHGFHLKQQCNNSTAILEWDSPVWYNTINQTSVVIEWQSTYDPPDRWHRVSERMNAVVGQAKVEKLPPGAKYRFRAITQNEYGDGPPSEPTKYESCETSRTRKWNTIY